MELAFPCAPLGGHAPRAAGPKNSRTFPPRLFAPLPALCQGRRPAHGKSAGAAQHRAGNKCEKDWTNSRKPAAQRRSPFSAVMPAGRTQNKTGRSGRRQCDTWHAPAQKPVLQGRGIEILVLITDQFQNCVRESLKKEKLLCGVNTKLGKTPCSGCALTLCAAPAA